MHARRGPGQNALRARVMPLLFALVLAFSIAGLVATTAQAGYADKMKKAACEKACVQAEKKCVSECTDVAGKDLCELGCEEGRKKCTDECG
jgi:hypothetical protein